MPIKSSNILLFLLRYITVINDNKCGRDVSPTTEIWMDNGVRQLNFDHDIVLAWVKVVLELHTPLDMGNVDILYSRSCDEWLEYESTGMNIVSTYSHYSVDIKALFL